MSFNFSDLRGGEGGSVTPIKQRCVIRGTCSGGRGGGVGGQGREAKRCDVNAGERLRIGD